MADEPESTDDAAEAADAADAADRALPEPAWEEAMAAHEQRLADDRRYAIEAGRRKGGLAGAAMAGAMFAMSEIVEGPKKDDKPVTVEASSDPDDVDRDGIAVQVGEVEIGSPALPTLDPVTERTTRKPPQV